MEYSIASIYIVTPARRGEKHKSVQGYLICTKKPNKIIHLIGCKKITAQRQIDKKIMHISGISAQNDAEKRVMSTTANNDRSHRPKNNQLSTRKIKRKRTFRVRGEKAVRAFVAKDVKLYGNTCQIRGVGGKMR